MNDYISRQAAIDALHEYFDGMLETDTVFPNDLYHIFETLPAADVAPVVRCKDCKYWDDTEAEPLCEVLHDGDGVMYSPEPDDFCCYGERRED